MKYCKLCRKVYDDSKEKCDDAFSDYSMHKLETIDTDTEAKCYKCGSTENLEYFPKWKSSYGTEFDDRYKCQECIDKDKKESARQEAMSYVIYDKDCGEFNYVSSRSEAIKWFEEAAIDDRELDSDQFLIFKVEKIEDIDKEHIDTNIITNLLVYDEEFYKIEEIFKPTIEYNGEVYVDI